MRFRGSVWLLLVLGVVFGLLLAVPSTVVFAQDNGGDNGGGDSSSSTAGGIIIDAQGVLRLRAFMDPDGEVMRERMAAAKASLGPKVSSFSKLRKISLNRLEQAILDQQGSLNDEMRYMAGLLRVRYVFYYPESKDIVLAGPAEGWVDDPNGRVVGMTSRRPVVQLQDVAVALRMFPAGGKPAAMIGCSIDPTQEGLASMQQYLRVNYPDPRQPQPFVEGLRNSLGYQTVSLYGVPPKTRFAQIMVEADYRMKLIGIGLESPPVHLVSYVEKARPGDVSQNALQRWYFVPEYQCVRQSADKLAMELVGDGVKLVGEDEAVGSSGERRTAAGRGNAASRAFVTGFTKKYAELAERSPIYAELRNLIDLSVAAAYIQAEDYYGQSGWKAEFLCSEKSFPVEVFNIPKTVQTAVNAIWKGNSLMTPIGGGVTIQAAKALESENRLADEKGKVGKLYKDIQPNLAKGQWWWD